MSATRAQEGQRPHDSTVHQKIENIKSQLDKLISRIQKEPSYTPTREDIGKYAVQINDVIMNNRNKVRPLESYLKAAIIDLTEVPEMHPQMQRISFRTALTDASQKLKLFLEESP